MNRSPGFMVEVVILPPHSVEPDNWYSPGPSSVAITVSCDHALAGLNNTSAVIDSKSSLRICFTTFVARV
jgi:hypothetical protein